MKKVCATFETSSTDGLTEFLWPVVRDGKVQKKVERTMETKLVGFCK